MFVECTEIKSRRKIFTAKEEGKTYTLNNQGDFEIAKVKIDGCVLKDANKKCDWMFLVEDEIVIFVELKGSDVNGGLKQLHDTYFRLKNNLRYRNFRFRICVGEKNSVPRSVRANKIYTILFEVSQGNIRIGKQLSDTLTINN